MFFDVKTCVWPVRIRVLPMGYYLVSHPRLRCWLRCPHLVVRVLRARIALEGGTVVTTNFGHDIVLGRTVHHAPIIPNLHMARSFSRPDCFISLCAENCYGASSAESKNWTDQEIVLVPAVAVNKRWARACDTILKISASASPPTCTCTKSAPARMSQSGSRRA